MVKAGADHLRSLDDKRCVFLDGNRGGTEGVRARRPQLTLR